MALENTESIGERARQLYPATVAGQPRPQQQDAILVAVGDQCAAHGIAMHIGPIFGISRLDLEQPVDAGAGATRRRVASAPRRGSAASSATGSRSGGSARA